MASITQARPWSRVGVIVAYTFIGLWTLLPFYWLLVTSIAGSRALLSFPPPLFPSEWTLQWYQELLGLAPPSASTRDTAAASRLFLNAMGNSLFAAGLATAIGLLLGIPAAYAYARLRSPARSVFFLLTFLVHTVPPFATVLPIYILLRNVGLLNSKTGIILVYSALAVTYVIWMMTAIIRGIPKDLEDSARIDGCTRFQAFLRVVLPILRPAIVAAGLLVFISLWNEFLYVLVLVNDAANKTVPLVISEYSTQERINYGLVMASGALVSVPPVLIALVFQRRIVSGLTAGATKG
jgi:multiple sugar transport system permease protein